MRKKHLISFSLLFIFCFLALPKNIQAKEHRAIYLGVDEYNLVAQEFKDQFSHRFYLNGQEIHFLVDVKDNYALQNRLEEGRIYDLTIQGDTVTGLLPVSPLASGPFTKKTKNQLWLGSVKIKTKDFALKSIQPKVGGARLTDFNGQLNNYYEAYIIDSAIYFRPTASPYKPPVSGQPGLRTVKNLLSTALTPVGTTLYIYGGAWNWQDDGSANQATTIGLPQSTLEAFQLQNENFSYKDNDDPLHSYYPHMAFNQYYYYGMDCSGYVGWTIYNLMNTIHGQPGYVMSASAMATNFADKGWGSFQHEVNPSELKPGDIFSMAGHVWITLGTCPDGSVVILHSTPSDSRSGAPGGGVQLSGLGTSEEDQAVELAKKYMSKYYPQWDQRYEAVYRSIESFMATPKEHHGNFSWFDGPRGLEDPDNYRQMDASEILKDLFGE